MADVEGCQLVVVAVQPCQSREIFHSLKRRYTAIGYKNIGYICYLRITKYAIAVRVELTADVTSERVVREVRGVDFHTAR